MINITGNNNLSAIICNSDECKIDRNNSNNEIIAYSFDNANNNEINEIAKYLSAINDLSNVLEEVYKMCKEKDRIYYTIVVNTLPFKYAGFSLSEIRSIVVNYLPLEMTNNTIITYQRMINPLNGERVREENQVDFLSNIGGYNYPNSGKYYGDLLTTKFEDIKSQKIINYFLSINIDLEEKLNKNTNNDILYIYIQSNTSLLPAVFYDLVEKKYIYGAIILNDKTPYAFQNIYDQDNNGKAFHLDDKYIDQVGNINQLNSFNLGRPIPLYEKIFDSFEQMKTDFTNEGIENIVWSIN